MMAIFLLKMCFFLEIYHLSFKPGGETRVSYLLRWCKRLTCRSLPHFCLIGYRIRIYMSQKFNIRTVVSAQLKNIRDSLFSLTSQGWSWSPYLQLFSLLADRSEVNNFSIGAVTPCVFNKKWIYFAVSLFKNKALDIVHFLLSRAPYWYMFIEILVAVYSKNVISNHWFLK